MKNQSQFDSGAGVAVARSSSRSRRSRFHPDLSQRKWSGLSRSGFALTERDAKLLVRLWEDRILERSQIQEAMGFGCKTRANLRLRKLFDNGFVERYFLPTLAYRGSSQALYFVGKSAVPIISDALGLSKSSIERGIYQLKQKIKTHGFLYSLDHTLAVADVRLLFERAIKSNPQNQMELVSWIPERLLQERFVIYRQGERLIHRIRPDAYFRYSIKNDGEKIYSAFVEVDLATMTASRAFREKVLRYVDYLGSGKMEERYHHKLVRILVITKGEVRLTNLLKVTEEVVPTLFWFTSFEKLQAAYQRSRLFEDEIWYRAGQKGLHSLSGY